MCGDCVVTCTSTRSPTRSRVSGLGLDVRVLDEAGLEDALDLDLRSRERVVQIAATNVAADQDVAVARVVQPGRAGSLGVVDRHHGRQLVPGHRERRHVQRRHRLRLADDHGDGLTPEAHLLVGFGEHRLIGGRRDHAEHVAAGDVGRGHDRDDSRRCGDERVQVAEPEAGPVVRRAHDPDRRGLLRATRRRRTRPCRPPCVGRRRAERDVRPPCRPVAAVRRPPPRRAFITAAMILR